jgi:O-antigen ligase
MGSSLGSFFIGQPLARVDRLAKWFLVASVFFMPLSTALANIMMAVTLLAWLASGGFLERLRTIRKNIFAYATAALLAIIAFGAIYSTGSTTEIQFQLHKYAKLLFVFPALSLMHEQLWCDRGIKAFCLAMFLTLLLSLASATASAFNLGRLGFGSGDNYFVFKDHIAQNLMMSFFVLILAVGGRFEKIVGKKYIFYLLALAGVIDIMFFVHGRTGYISLTLNAVIFLIFVDDFKKLTLTLILFLAIAVVTIQFSSGFRSRFDQAVSEYQARDRKELTSVGQRLEYIEKGLLLISERPLQGFGTGSYRKEFCRVAESDEWCAVGGAHPHNQFIAFGVQLGLVGVFAYLLFLGACVKQAICSAPREKILGLGLVATLVTDSMFHAPLFLVSEAAFFMLMLSLFMGLNSADEKDTKQI